MDRFLKRTLPQPELPAAKQSKSVIKQGDVTAQIRSTQYVGVVFYADGSKMFCRVCNIVVVGKHVKAKVRSPLLNDLRCFVTNWFNYSLSLGIVHLKGEGGHDDDGRWQKGGGGGEYINTNMRTMPALLVVLTAITILDTALDTWITSLSQIDLYVIVYRPLTPVNDVIRSMKKNTTHL